MHVIARTGSDADRYIVGGRDYSRFSVQRSCLTIDFKIK